MRKLLKLFIAICIVLFSSLLYANQQHMMGVLARVNAGGGSCTTSVDTGAAHDTDKWFGHTSITHRAHSFTTSKQYDICKIDIDLLKVGAPGGTISLYVCDDDGAGKPNEASIIVTSGTTYTAADLTTSYQVKTFTFVPTTLSNATRYHWVVYCDQVNDASNYFRTNNNAAGTENHSYSVNGTDWTIQDASSTMDATTYE